MKNKRDRYCDCCDNAGIDEVELIDGCLVCWFCYTVLGPSNEVAENARLGNNVNPKDVFSKFRNRWISERSLRIRA